MSKPKIVIGITDSISAVLIRGQAAFLQKNGFEVAVFSASGSEIVNLSDEEKFKLFKIPFKREISLKNDLKALVASIKYLKRFNPDIVNAGTPKAGFILMIASFLCRVPVRVFTLRGIRSSSLSGNKKQIVSLTEKISCKLATKVIAISPSLKKEAIMQGLVSESNCIVLKRGSSNGISLTKFAKADINPVDLAEKCSKLNIKTDQRVIGFVGRLVKEKGIVELLAAYKSLKLQYRIKLLLIGPFEVDDALPVNVVDDLKDDEDIVLVGKVDDVQNYYPLFDLLVLPSYREGFGNVIIESAAMGIPSVASDIPGCKDAVENNFSGLLFKPKSSNDLASKIKFYLDNPKIRIQHGQQAKERALKFFPNEVIWNEQLSLYEKLINLNFSHYKVK